MLRTYWKLIYKRLTNRVKVVHIFQLLVKIGQLLHYQRKNDRNSLKSRFLKVIIAIRFNRLCYKFDEFRTIFGVTAMQTLKESLYVYVRMGWNYHLFASTNWDAWDGVTCNLNKDESALQSFRCNYLCYALPDK